LRKQKCEYLDFFDENQNYTPWEYLQECQKSLHDPIALSPPYVVQFHVSHDTFTHFMEIRDGVESHFSPETFDELMVLAREFGYNSLITSLGLQRDAPRREENKHHLSHEFDRKNRTTTVEIDFQSHRGCFHATGFRESATERGIGSDQKQTVEGHVGCDVVKGITDMEW
jgi:hypothetical protein